MGPNCVRPAGERRLPPLSVNMSNDPENASTPPGPSPIQALAPQPPVPPLLPREIWKLRDLLLFLAILPFALLVSKLVLLMGYAVLRPFAGWHLKADAAQFDTVFLLVQQCVWYTLLLAFLFLSARFQHQLPFWKSLGWKTLTLKQAAGYLAGGIALAVATSLVLWLLPDSQVFPLEKLFSSRAASFALGAFAISFAPVVEEVFFRGLLFAVVENVKGWPLAAAISAVLFAALHVPEYWHAWHHLILILVVGIVLSLARGISGSLTPSIILHIGYNSLIVISLFFSTQHFRAMNGFWAW
jgi:membrane protease YdiL (CAAX protease family)